MIRVGGRCGLWGASRGSLAALLAASPSLAQDEPDSLAAQQALTVFLDCDRCDDDYIRREITFVNYVRDRT